MPGSEFGFSLTVDETLEHVTKEVVGVAKARLHEQCSAWCEPQNCLAVETKRIKTDILTR